MVSFVFRILNWFRSKGKPCILIVDDDPDFNFLVKDHLDRAGLFTLCEISGPKGIQTANRCRPRVILLDISMPGMHGFEVLKELKKAPVTKAIPVVMLTSRDDEESKVRSEHLHVAGFVTKSADFKVFETKVRALLDPRSPVSVS